MKLKSILFTLLGSFLIFGCANSETASLDMMAEAATNQAPQVKEVMLERKLIKEGSVGFETNDMAATRKSIFESVEKYKAYVSSDQEYKSSSSIRNTIVIRVPAAHFDALLKDATKGVTKFDSKSIQIKDVTEEFLDVQARLKTKKELENRYLEISKEAKNVTELLEVEKQLGLLRSEIESIEGRMNYLENQVSLSTLTMDFYRTIPTQTQFGNKFANGFKNGWDNLIWFFVGLINIWPFLILVFGIVFWLVWRKRRKAQA